MAARHCSSWADFQPELLGLVLRRLLSLADRVRLGAVCRSWRHGARLEPVPHPFPWLALLDGTFLSVPDGEVHCIPAAAPGNTHCHGSVGGGWLFLQHFDFDSGVYSLSLTNPFSEDVLRMPDADAIWRHEPLDDHDAARGPILHKPPVPLSPMDGGPSPDSLFAVLITDCAYESVISIFNSSAAAACRVPGRERITDVALVGGKLYALSPRKLFVLDVDSSCKAGEPKIPPMKPIADVDTAVDTPPTGILYKTIAGEGYACAYWNYLVESGGKLLHVRRLIGCLCTLPDGERMEHSRTFSFEVYEVDMAADPCVQWRRLSSLGGQALFVGPSSKFVQASECCGAQPDCIYFICDYDWGHSWADPLRDCGVFDMRNGTVTPLLPETTVMRPKDVGKGRSEEMFYSARPGWFFPS